MSPRPALVAASLSAAVAVAVPGVLLGGTASAAPAAASPSATSLLLGSGAVPGFKAGKPETDTGPTYDDGCAATHGRVLTLPAGGSSADVELSKLEQGTAGALNSLLFESVSVYPSVAAAKASAAAQLAEAKACGVQFETGATPAKAKVTSPPTVPGLTPVTRLVVNSSIQDRKIKVMLDVYRRGRVLLSTFTIAAKGVPDGSGGATVTYVAPSSAQQAALDRAAGKKIVARVPAG